MKIDEVKGDDGSPAPSFLTSSAPSSSPPDPSPAPAPAPASADPLLSEAASLKAQAVSLFKQSCFAQAAGIFANLSALASSISPPTSESTSFATAGYNNSALCYLKLNEWDKSMAASANCLALGDRLSGTSAAVVEAVLFKA